MQFKRNSSAIQEQFLEGPKWTTITVIRSLLLPGRPSSTDLDLPRLDTHRFRRASSTGPSTDQSQLAALPPSFLYMCFCTCFFFRFVSLVRHGCSAIVLLHLPQDPTAQTLLDSAQTDFARDSATDSLLQILHRFCTDCVTDSQRLCDRLDPATDSAQTLLRLCTDFATDSQRLCLCERDFE